jgi:hypothetical protein
LKFASANTNSIELLKQTILLEMTTTLVNKKYKGKANPKATYNRLRHARLLSKSEEEEAFLTTYSEKMPVASP